MLMAEMFMKFTLNFLNLVQNEERNGEDDTDEPSWRDETSCTIPWNVIKNNWKLALTTLMYEYIENWAHK